MQKHKCNEVENVFPIFKVSRLVRVHGKTSVEIIYAQSKGRILRMGTPTDLSAYLERPCAKLQANFAVGYAKIFKFWGASIALPPRGCALDTAGSSTPDRPTSSPTSKKIF